MAFDLSTARPLEEQPQAKPKSFDLSTAKPIQAVESVAPVKEAPQQIAAPQKEPTLWGQWSEFVTGAEAESRLPKDVRKLPELNEMLVTKTFDVGTGDIQKDLKIAASMMATMNPQARQDVIRSAYPEATFEQYNDTTVANFPDGRRAIIDKAGLSPQDVQTLSAQVLAYLPAAKLANAVKPLLTRAGVMGVASGATNYGLQKGTQALGSEQPVNKTEVGLTGLLGAGAELGGALFGGIARKFEQIPERAAINKMTREGFENAETAPYVLRSPQAAQQAPIQQAPIEQRAPLPEFIDTPAELVSGGGLDAPIPENIGLPIPPKGIIETTKELLPIQGRVIKSPAAAKALEQKVPEAVITNIREANPATLEEMKKITRYHWQTKQNPAGANTTNPYRVVGDQFVKRMDTVSKRQTAAIQQQTAAREDLKLIKGKDLFENKKNIANKLNKSLKDNDISVDSETGMLDFSDVPKGDPLNKPSNRKALNDHYFDFKNARSADDLHKLKKNLQESINYEKKGVKAGFDSKTETILKNLARDVNAELRALSPAYKEANDVLSTNIEAYKMLEDSMPALKKFDYENPENLVAANNLIGAQIRNIDSNNIQAPKIEAAIDKFDDLASQYGAKFDVDVKRLSRHLSNIKLRLGDRSGTFMGQQEAAVTRGNAGLVQSVKNKGSDIMKFLEPETKITDKEAYKSILDYIDESKTRRTK